MAKGPLAMCGQVKSLATKRLRVAEDLLSSLLSVLLLVFFIMIVIMININALPPIFNPLLNTSITLRIIISGWYLNLGGVGWGALIFERWGFWWFPTLRGPRLGVLMTVYWSPYVGLPFFGTPRCEGKVSGARGWIGTDDAPPSLFCSLAPLPPPL